MNRRKAGFTLIELMVVVAIIGMLAAIVVPRVGREIDYARQKATLAAMSRLSERLDFYRMDHGRHPGTLDDLLKDIDQRTRETYLAELPDDAWDTPFDYRAVDGGKDYELRSLGADRVRGGEDFDADLVASRGKAPAVEGP